MEHGVELIIARLEILEIEVCNILQNPGNITQSQNPIPNPTHILSWTRDGLYGRTRTRAAGGIPKPEPTGGLRPPDPRSGFFGAVRGPASYLFIVLFYYSSSSVIFV